MGRGLREAVGQLRLRAAFSGADSQGGKASSLQTANKQCSQTGRQQQVSLGHLPSPFCVGLRVQQCQCPSLEVTAVGAQLAAAQVLC